MLFRSGPGAGKNPFALRKNAAYARNYTPLELRAAHWRILRAREKIVTSNAGYEFLKTEMLRVMARRARK